MKITDKRKKVQPYEGLAGYYDELMEHVNYKQWSRYIKSIFSRQHKRVRSLIDLSCGTGSHLTALGASRRVLFAADNSLPMLKQAKSKNPDRVSGFINADFRRLPFCSNKFDAVVSLYDSVNYLLKDRDVLLFLQETLRILNSGGLLIFDVVTPYTCIKFFKDYHEENFDEQNNGYERRSWFDARRAVQHNRFRLKHEGRVLQEEHKQRIRSIEEWSGLVDGVPFNERVQFGDFTLLPPKETAERVHFVCRKK